MIRVLTVAALTSCVLGCASNPDKIDATYVSPARYEAYDCQQIAAEMDNVDRRTEELYASLKAERDADNWQMGVGLVLFWPSLFFLEGGDGPEAAEYAQLKGEYEALRQNSLAKHCGIDARSPEQIMKEADERSKRESPASSASGAAGGVSKTESQLRDIARASNCNAAISQLSDSGAVSSWLLSCTDGRKMSVDCDRNACYVRSVTEP